MLRNALLVCKVLRRGPTKESNWLPAPDGKDFSLNFRCYVPKDVVSAAHGSPGNPAGERFAVVMT